MSVIAFPIPESRGIERTFLSMSGTPGDLPADRLTSSHQSVLRYWNERRGDRPAAARASIDPCDLRGALPQILLWEIDGAGEYRCRLAGTEIDRTLGRGLTGATLGNIRCSRIEEARREFDAVRDDALLSFAERTLIWAGKPHLYYRHLLLPLTGATGSISVLLSVLTFHSLSERRLHA
jgi:hypothetical protein